MKTIIGCALVATALIAGAAVAHAAERYVSSGQEFEVTIPNGWKHVPIDGPLKLILISPRIQAPEQGEKSLRKEGGICIFIVGDTAETRQMTQQQINEAGEKDINDDFWRQLATASNQGHDKVSSSKSSVVSSRTEMRGDRRVYLATLRFEGTFKEDTTMPFDLRSDLVLHLIPGRALASNCIVDSAKAAPEEADFKIIADSFNPLGNSVVASMRQPGRAVPIAAVRPAFVARGMLQYTLINGRDRAVTRRLR
jgi:hypothetical protein